MFSNIYTPDDVHTIVSEKPHLLGHLAGKTLLSDIHSKWILDMWGPERQRSLQAHRGSYKTTAILVIGCIRWMLLHPDDRIFIIRKNFTDAAEIVETIDSIMQLPEIKELFRIFTGEFPSYKIKRKEKITYSFKRTATPEGNLNPFGLDATLTGRHCDVAFLDDFVTLRDRVSKAERETTKTIVREIATNIIDPGKPVRYVGTPWHKQDAWSICPKPEKYSIKDLSIFTSEEVEEKRKTTTGALFAANYLLEHVPDEGCLFSNPIWGKWKTTGIEAPRAHLDAAFDGEHYCALTIMAKRHDGKIQAVGWTYPGNVKEWIPEVINKLRFYNCRKIYNEDNPDKGWTADILKGERLFVHTYNEQMNKHIKISTYLYEAWSNIIWVEETEPEYLNQILDYMERQEPDDAPDSASSLVQKCFSQNKAARAERWRW